MLRRMEREEVMKTTIRWILGPDFDLVPSAIEALYTGDPGGLQSIDPSRLTHDVYSSILNEIVTVYRAIQCRPRQQHSEAQE